MIYLDNNATTVMSQETIAEMVSWCNRGNPSAGYASAKEARAMMEKMRQYLGKLCGFNPCCQDSRDGNNKYSNDLPNYTVLFTSGASEANCTVLSGTVDAYAAQHNIVPHIVMSAIEHKSLLSMAESYESRGLASVTFVAPTLSGHIRPEDVAAAVQNNTCIICVMHANNETGAINDIHAIGELAANLAIPFHCDTVQSFGKYPVNVQQDRVSSFCISFHKLGGPPGVGALIHNNINHMHPMIFGTQNSGHRGGTENLPGIGASLYAIGQCMLNRQAKNKMSFALKHYLMNSFSSCAQYTQYKRVGGQPTIVFMSGSTQYYLPNTILLAVMKYKEPYVCNTKIKEYLEKQGIVVSVGSACNTASAKASHVLYAMDADMYIRKGAIRVSLGDLTTLDEIKTFIRVFRDAAAVQGVKI